MQGLDKQPSELAILAHVRRHYVAARWRNVLIVYWQKQGSLQAVQKVDALLGQMAETTELRISCVHLIKDGAGLPDDATRAAVRALHQRHADRLACLGVVLMGGGFWASALQSVLTALRAVGGPRSSTMRFARTPSELADWLPAEHAARTGVRLQERELAAAIARVLDVGNASPSLAS